VDERAVVTWEFSTDLFDRSRIERLIRHYYTLTAAALANPDLRVSELPLLDPAEEARVLDEWSGRPSAYPRDLGLPELFARQAVARPDEPAVTFGGESLSFRELDRRSAAIARRLAEAGVGRGTPVALALERSADLVPAVLGIVRAGGCYVPLDAGYPRERLAFMLEDSGARVVVADAHAAENLPAAPGVRTIRLDDPAERARPEEPGAGAPDVPVGPDDAAYVIYTSGSTGRPKAVVVPHRAVARLVLEADFARFEPGDVYLQLAPVSFDAATLEIWAPLLTGGRLVVHPPEAPTLEGLSGILAAEGVTTLWLTAGLFHQMVDDDPGAFAPVRQLLAGGDVLSPEHCRRVLAACPGLTLVNGYGPTENTTFTTCHRMAAAAEVPEPVPIGRPIADTRAYVVDPGFRPEPAGVPGELVTGGDGLAWGYWRRPALTAERFVPDPFAERRGERGARVYRTGDRVRWRPSGELEFLGRYDTQVKVRGFRVEPGEVEAALARLPGVAEALVLPVAPAGERILAAFVVPREGEAETLSPGALRAVLAESLPAHMVPQAFVLLERFPLTPNGKVDRKALAERVDAGRAAEQEVRYLAPRTPLEEAVAGIWSAFLPVERVGVRDDFFDLGGHSLIATRIVSRIRKDLGVALPLGALFELPTVEALCRELAAAGAVVAREAAAAVGNGQATAADPWGLGEDLAGRADSLSDQELDALLGRMLVERGS
jgi:amino acid adenylation domain-containing protein